LKPQAFVARDQVGSPVPFLKTRLVSNGAYMIGVIKKSVVLFIDLVLSLIGLYLVFNFY
jgi:hypothetical protein